MATTSTMRLPYVLPSRTIAIVEIMLSTSFCAVPAFSRVEPAMHLGADDDGDLVLGEPAELGAVDGDDGHRERPGPRRLGERAERRRASGRSR